MLLDNAQKKILLIEDDDVYRRWLMSTLGFDFEIFEADSGEMAMEKVLFHYPDLIVLDIMMPKVDGFQVLYRLRSYPDPKVSGIPAIVLTNLNNPDDIVKAQQFNVFAYLVKSNTQKEEILASIQRAVMGLPSEQSPQVEATSFPAPPVPPPPPQI